MKTEVIKDREIIDLSPFYDALENDRKLLESAFHNILQLIVSDPDAIQNLACVIRDEYPEFYHTLLSLSVKNALSDDKPSCCL